MSTYRKKLIEVSLPLEAINAASAREKSIRHGHPSTLHLWWARRPLAAARAILFAQLVDDPSSWAELFPTEEAQNRERQRLFRLIEALVVWEHSNDEMIINAARLEIARSHARSSSSQLAKRILVEGVKPEAVNEYLATEVPPIHDPFAGGGTIPLEAQRLGLRAVATDLNPVAVMINKALIEFPPQCADMPPVNPESLANGKIQTWTGTEGLAEDVRYYGKWIDDEARKRIAQLYPDVELPKEHGGGKATVIGWLWARTVESPNPAFKGCQVPLVSSYWLSATPGKEVWIAHSVAGRTYQFEIRTGKPGIEKEAIGMGTKLGRGASFRCVLSGVPIEPEYVKREAKAGRLGTRLMAIVVTNGKGRIFLPPNDKSEHLALSARPTWKPEQEMPKNPRWFSPPDYGMPTYGDLFTARQLVALTTFSDLVSEAQVLVRDHWRQSAQRTSDAADYPSFVATYLSFAVSRLADRHSSLSRWDPNPSGYAPKIANTFSRQALPMVWDFIEGNPFSESSGNFVDAIGWIAKVIDNLPRKTCRGTVSAADAAERVPKATIISTDPPYYDNIGYADLSEFFYLWLRRSLRASFSDLFARIEVPKAEELIATPYRHGTKVAAEKFFLDGMSRVLVNIASGAVPGLPVTIYYAFKQSERSDAGTSSTGWEAFLSAVLAAGFVLDGTLPIRTELANRIVGKGTNALASSIVLVCRRRPDDAASTTRGEFRRLLRKELPDALKKLQQGNIAPVDVAQASIGPGMAIFSRHKQVSEADGSGMTVRSALQLINEVLDEYLSSGEGDFDADTRFAITWYEQYGWDAGLYGEAETLAKARNVSVKGVEEAGICKSAAGKVRILKRSELPPDYDPAADERATIWEFTQHMIRNLEEGGEEAAARLLKKLGPAADATRELAYRLYNTCERKKWAEDARSYNGLILAWTELEKLASRMGDEPPPAASSKTVNGKKKSAKAPKGTKAQRDLFEGDEK